MELSKAIRTGYFGALDGNVTYSSADVPIYDSFALPQDATNYPYIILSSQTDNQREQKTGKTLNATILIDIVTGDKDNIGRAQSEDIAEQIEDILNPDSNTSINISANGWKISDTLRSESFEFTDKNDKYYIFRKLLRYTLLISKS